MKSRPVRNTQVVSQLMTRDFVFPNRWAISFHLSPENPPRFRHMATPAHPVRTRTSHWGDPMLTVLAAKEKISGLELLRKLIAGDYPAPPIAELLGFRLTEV